VELSGGAFIFLAFLIVGFVAVAYAYYSKKGDVTARRDRNGLVNQGKDATVDVNTWGRGSDSSRRKRRQTPLEARTAEALGDPALRARASGAVQLVAPVDPARDHITGPADAEVTLVEYGEYECRYCKEADLVVERLRERSDGAVRVVFRHFPQESVHAHALEAAVAAEAAGRQDRFWELHALMARSKKALEGDHIRQLAGKAGLDPERFAADQADPALRQRVLEDQRSGVESGVNGTPTFFLNNIRYDDEVDEAELRAAIERARAVAASAGAGGIA
jgi:protein-disulfide isomerase